MKFHHIGVVARDLDAARAHLSATLAIAEWSATVDDPGIGVSVCFGQDGSGVRYELIAPLGNGSPVAGHLGEDRAILNHVAYTVPNLDQAAADLRAARCFPLGAAQPAKAFSGRRVQFFMSPLRFIIELIEA